ncbi:DUF6113 family protein [Spirillospora sp. NPDC049652]
MNEDDAPTRRTDEPAPPPPAAPAPAPDSSPEASPEAAPEASPEAAPAADPDPRLEAVVSGAGYGVLALLGFAYGVFGAFHQDWTVGSFPLPSLLLCAVLFALVFGAGYGMRTKLGAVIPAAAWMIVTFVMSSKQPEGDLVIPGTTAGYVYIVGGLVTALVAIAVVPTRRPSGEWLTGGRLGGGGGDTRG